ncbi:sulfatase-like hydrolase/transferase [Tamlana sp. I1]|uniref:sulfatase-like hydrolase/transferase n=1 Tax=Tamlana sp. I1 TaxID=2762061 RepID=UPI0018904DE9|nr:sulfatase-like hydrolase/transferase [Tamlana sp. I1]
MKLHSISTIPFYLKNQGKKILTMLFLALFSSIGAQDEQKPNIIFILTDDLGYGDLGVFYQDQLALDITSGIPRQFTPYLDQMSHEGATLSQHYAAAPVCAPSRASLLLGRNQGHSNIRDNQFDKALDNNYTLGSTLQKAGYSTAAIGKWGMQGRHDEGPNWTAHPLNRGFDYYMGYIRHVDGHEHYPKEGTYRGSKEVYENRKNITANLDKCYTTDLWTAVAKKWIVDHKKSNENKKPFFMYLAYDTPHAVLELPTQAYPEGNGLNGGIQWTGKPGKMINTASGKVDSWIHPDYVNATYDDDGKTSTPEIAWPDIYKRYATDVRRIDRAVGDILQLLKDLDIDNNTMVIFTSDNGPSRESYIKNKPINPTFFKSFGPFDGIKRDCWEGGLRMPTIAWWPENIPTGHTIETPSISYDWMPTFVNMAGLPAPAISDGVSLLPSLLNKGNQQNSNIYVEYFQSKTTPNYKDFIPARRGGKRNQMQMLRIDNLVGVRYDIKKQDDDFEIYDVVKDPQQTNNLAKNAGMKTFQQELKDRALQSRIANNTAVRPYDNELIPAKVINNTNKGLVWKVYKGNFPWVPALETFTPDNKGTTKAPNTKIDTNQAFGALYIEGYIKIPEDGVYNFYITTDKGALLRIHDAAVIDADYNYFGNSTKSGTLRLKAGLHPIRLYSIHGEKVKKLNLEWSSSKISKQTIPASQFFH